MTTTKKENPDTFLVEYTERLIIQHLLLSEDHFLEYHREPSSQCLACLYWHLEKLIAYSSLECIKFEGMDMPLCRQVWDWAKNVQDGIDKMTQEEALTHAKEARELRYRFTKVGEKEAKMQQELNICILEQIPKEAAEMAAMSICPVCLAEPDPKIISTKPICTPSQLKKLKRCVEDVKKRLPEYCTPQEWSKPISERREGCYSPFSVCSASVSCRPGRAKE